MYSNILLSSMQLQVSPTFIEEGGFVKINHSVHFIKGIFPKLVMIVVIVMVECLR